MEPLYSRAELPSLQEVCIAAGPQPLYHQKTIYAFDDERLVPDPSGPRVRERPREGLPRALEQSRAVLEDHRDALRQCYRWARYPNRSLQGVVRVEVRIDPFGAWGPVRAVPELAGGAELAACVETVLVGGREDQVTPRNTDGQFRIRFVPSSQRQAQRAPLRPAASPKRAASGPACLLLPAQIPTDRLASQEPLLEIDDYDVQQATEDDELDYQQKLAALKRSGKLGPRPVLVPRLESIGCSMPARHVVGTEEIRRSLRYNRGAYGACYAQALTRRPELAGRVVLGATVDYAGRLTVRVRQSTVHDPEVEECLRRAVEEVWFEPWVQSAGRVEFTYPLVLEPTPVLKSAVVPHRDTLAGIEARAQTQLDYPDGKAALRSYSALLRQLPEHPHACQWHVGALAATLTIAPWQDERVLAAAKDLVAALTNLTFANAAPLRSACLSQAAPLLTRLATDAHRRGASYRLTPLWDLALQRYQLVLGVGPDLPDADELRYHMAEALWSQHRYCEAAPIYVQAALGHPQERKAKEAARAALLSSKRCLHLDAEKFIEALVEGLGLR